MPSPLLDSLGLAMLEYHWKTLLSSAFTCHLIIQFSQRFSPVFFPRTYPQMHPSKRLNWDVHVVSTVHSVLIVLLSAPLLWNEALMENKIFGYDVYGGHVYAIACGYFLWDALHSIVHVKEFGIGFVFHGICSFCVFIFSFRPFLQYYGSVFLMFELSTPFLNMHWFMDKLNMTGSIYQLVNGICLLVVFFCARIVFGFYMSYQTFINVMPVIDQIPMHLQIIYSAANVVLNSLNIFWFFKMIESIMKRFSPKSQPRTVTSATSNKKSKGAVSASTSPLEEKEKTLVQ